MTLRMMGLVAASSLSLALAACGGDEEPENTEAATPPAETEIDTAAAPEPTPEPVAAPEPEAPAPQTIVQIAGASPEFATLVAAVQAADLVDTLSSEGPFTVFAPTNEAFAALPEGTVDSLLLPENKDQLVAVLKYHVISGEVMSADLAGAETTTVTVEGSEITIDATGADVLVGNAKVTTADIEASNGVIHVIDAVLLPPAAE